MLNAIEFGTFYFFLGWSRFAPPRSHQYLT